MLIPYGTDAPIYHWPFATGAMMLLNIVALVVQFANPELQGDYILVHGDGLYPVQWLTSMFMHAGIVHLVGNLIFLWSFGIIVEGKVGPLVFTLLYVGIGVTQCMVEQVVFLSLAGAAGGSLGASSAIFGLMMIALFWAPQDNLKIIFNPILFYIFFIEVPVAFFGLVYFLWDFSNAFFNDFSFGTSVLHLMGAVLGIVVGVIFICASWVDCEGNDLLSMFRELAGMRPIEKKQSAAEQRAIEDHKQVLKQERRSKTALYRKSIAAHLSAGNGVAAAAAFGQIKRLNKKAVWDEAELLKLIAVFQSNAQWDQTVDYGQLYLKSFETKKVAVAINLAKIYLLEKHSPRRALKVIAPISSSPGISDKQRSVMTQIRSKADQMIVEGVIELD